MENKLILYCFRDLTLVLAMTFRRNIAFIYFRMRVARKLKAKSNSGKAKLNYIQPLKTFDWKHVLVSLRTCN